MFVEIRNGAADVREAADLKSLSVRARAAADVIPGVYGLGEPDPDGEHVWLRVDTLRAAAEATIAEDQRAQWAGGFDGMIAYAVAKGWSTDDGITVRAHLDLFPGT